MSKVFLVMIVLYLMLAVGVEAKDVFVIGDEVVFLYYGCDSKKDVENEGVIVGVKDKKYIIQPFFQITPFGNYVIVQKEKVLRMAE